MSNSILDPIYNIINVFFPSELVAIPFFNFLINLLVFTFCSILFYITFIWPILTFFKWIRKSIRS